MLHNIYILIKPEHLVQHHTVHTPKVLLYKLVCADCLNPF